VSTLQWALLLLGLGIVVLLVWSSRRERKALERLNTPASPPASRDWGMEREAMAQPAGPPAQAAPPPPQAARPLPPAQLFDELGVGKPRKVPSLGVTATLPPGTRAPDLGSAPAEPAPDKVVGLYIAEHEGTNILGPKIHAALQDRGLRFGTKRIYHRYEGEHPIFSVASLVKPGSLDPAEAEGFATPGLSVFMVLPGPSRPVVAFQDMLDTARGLARALNAELYDSEQRAPLTPARERALHEQVEEWARRHTPAGRLSG
jgi:cell division protein ZipA